MNTENFQAGIGFPAANVFC